MCVCSTKQLKANFSPNVPWLSAQALCRAHTCTKPVFVLTSLSFASSPCCAKLVLVLVQDACFQICQVGRLNYLVALSPSTGCIKSVVLDITSRATTNCLVVGSQEDDRMLHRLPDADIMLNYVYYIFDKYPARAATGEAAGPLKLHLMLPSGKPAANCKACTCVQACEQVLSSAQASCICSSPICV